MFDAVESMHVDYLYPDVKPKIPNINLKQLIQIEQKLKDYDLGNKSIGLNKEELVLLLDWITYNARRYAVRYVPLSVETAISSQPMTGQCAPTQNINVKLSQKMHLRIHAFNTGDCIDKLGIPESPIDIQRKEHGFPSTTVRHSVAILTVPVEIAPGIIKECEILLDPTFIQFCKKELNQKELFNDPTWLKKDYVAPRPAYFMPKSLCKELIYNGYILFSPENAKLYGDAFRKASVRLEYQDSIPDITGEEYLNVFRTISMQLWNNEADEKKYARLPSEIYNSTTNQNSFMKTIRKLLSFFFSKEEEEYALPAHPSNLPSSKEQFHSIIKYPSSIEYIFYPETPPILQPEQEHNLP